MQMQPLMFERKFQMCEIVLARPIGSRICFFQLQRRGMGMAGAGGDKGFDMVGKTVERMPLA